jgi:hypothetical protein
MIAHASATFRTGSHVRTYAVRLLTGWITFGFFVLSAEMGGGAGSAELEVDSAEVEAGLTGSKKCWRSDDWHGARWRGFRTT